VGSFLPIFLVIEGTLGFIVFTVDTAVTEQASLQGRLLRAALGPATLIDWCSNLAEKWPALVRLGMNVWFLVTFGWLIAMEVDRLNSLQPFLAWGTSAFVVYCVDGTSVKLYKKPVRRVLRALFWPVAFAEYLCDTDTIRQIQASLIIWVLLITGWLLTLLCDHYGVG
jgi:hypothetical protein